MTKEEVQALIDTSMKTKAEADANAKAKADLEIKTKENEALIAKIAELEKKAKEGTQSQDEATNAKIAELEKKAKEGNEAQANLEKLKAEIKKAGGSNEPKIDKEKITKIVDGFSI